MNLIKHLIVECLYSQDVSLAGGVLVDLTKEASEAGGKIPVDMSTGLYHEYVKTIGSTRSRMAEHPGRRSTAPLAFD